MKLVRASDAWRLLNGVFCIHKPPDLALDRVKQMIREGICKDLNQLSIRPPGIYHRPVYKEHPSTGELMMVGHVTQLDYSDHPAVVGDRYQIEDIHLEAAQPMEDHTYGLCVFGINDGCELLPKLHAARFMKVYNLRGRLGRATVDFTERTKIMEKTTYHHVTPHRMAKVLARLLSEHQTQAFAFAGVRVDSQEAYELASKGMIRPKEDSSTILYGARCVGLKLPFFTLEIQCINETDEYFRNFIHELGLTLRSTACLSALRRMRHGHLTLTDHGLLRKHWTLEHILNNIQQCNRLISPKLLKPGPILGTDRLSNMDSTKYIDSIPSDFDEDYLQIGQSEWADEEKLMLENGDLVEERLSSNTKPTIPLESTKYDD